MPYTIQISESQRTLLAMQCLHGAVDNWPYIPPGLTDGFGSPLHSALIPTEISLIGDMLGNLSEDGINSFVL